MATLFLCLFLPTSSLLAKGGSLPREGGHCNTSAVVYNHNTTFGLNTNSGLSSHGSHKQILNIPVTVDGAAGCWKQQAGMKFKTQSKSSKFSGEIEVTLPKSEFQNIPNARMETYVFLDQQLSEDSNPLETVHFHIVNFTCAGENVLAREAYSGNFENLKDLQEMKPLNFSAVMAVGETATAQILNQRKVQIQYHMTQKESLGYTPSTPLYFLNLFQTRLHSTELPPLSSKVQILKPSVLTAHSFSGNISHYSDFSTLPENQADIYGCSKIFRQTLDDHHLSHFEEKMKSSDFKVRTNSKRIHIEWNNKGI